MPSSFSLGRIKGIPISANWSLIGLIVLLSWELATHVFPASDPGQSSITYTAMGIAAAFGLIACILLHELAHAIQALREGMRIHSITLWLFGGVARFDRFFPSGGAEIRIALAGPAISIVLGGAGVAAASLSAIPAAIATTLWWLGTMNLILGVFNLLPALPLDGGRALRGAMWATTRDLARATRVGVQVSKIVAIGMMTTGVVMAMSFGNPVSGIWLALIGLFVLQAGRQEAVPTPSAAAPQTLADILRPTGVSLPADVTVTQIDAFIDPSSQCVAIPVSDDDEVIGILPVAAVQALPAEYRSRTTARALMIPRGDLIRLSPTTDVATARPLLATSPWGYGLVVDNGVLLGIIGPQELHPTSADPE